jgi:hypothetical protein
MDCLIWTDDVLLRERREAWLSTVCDTLGPQDVWVDEAAPL